MSLAAATEPDYPYPPRFWWTRRIGLLIGGVLLVMLAVRLWWGHIATQRFNDAVAELRERGEPVLLEDFVLPDVPDERNYVFYIRQAYSAIAPNIDSPSSSNVNFLEYLPLPPLWHTMAAAAEQANTKTFALARQARQFSEVDWDLGLKSPSFSVLLPDLNSMRHLANLLGDTALYHHLNGRDHEAIEMLNDLFAQSASVRQQPFLVSHLVGTGIDAMGVHKLQIIAPGIQIADDPNRNPSAPATRQQVRDTIDLLIARSQRTMTYAMQGERMMQIDMNQWLTRRSTLLRPMFQLDSVRSMQIMEQQVWPTTPPTTYPAGWKPAETSADFPRLISAEITPSLNRVPETQSRLQADALAAAISLAVRLYRVDHPGQWPPSLESLVPDYLPSVPINPRSSTKSPFRYFLANNGRRPVLYLDGFDGDLSSELALLPNHPLYGWQSKFPQFRDLSRFDPPAPATLPATE